MNLLDEIQQELTNPSATTANILRKARVLASQLQSAELQRWAKSELDGYKREDELPTYRKMHMAPFGTIYEWGSVRRNVPIPTLSLPSDLKQMITEFLVTEKAAALEELTKSGEESFQIKHRPELTEVLRKHFEPGSADGLIETYQPVPKYIYSGILDGIKNRLLEFVLEMKENNVNPSEPNSTKTNQDLVKGAVVNHIYGNNNTVAVGDQISQQVNLVQKGDIESLFDQLREYEVPEEDLEDLKDAISAAPESTSGNLDPRVGGWIGEMAKKAASGAWKTAAKNPGLVIEAVKQFSSGQSPAG